MKHLLEILNTMKDLLAEIRGLRGEMKLWKKYDTENHHENDKRTTELLGRIAVKVGASDVEE